MRWTRVRILHVCTRSLSIK